ncbi:50S ribosomal protein L35 [candidate division WWE3 bacterium CG06_land_8_20_14_3_00_42_16]|uniref:Large ribosomal subunit protein bL35 n=4 Tax=Katanobacteria TaxID=422282 RepID=A0A2M7AMZ1_UNCKA|nr:MAG: 50S ribosomal protein L35 [candidate division WWE3 bacterium CG06_land_8_20_14_3_00_42_16]PIZ43457.1 MAG: 50S ribosomal protein L35 [candidate division WWE3 bacterium CG_4_10_14_0_2_um_filter_42_8]PJA37721.1 MAG: 50S ribosomal protein L35 [candidate division WWE3 bacterium CG_4_9_14_3_um_filter_43_9]PJC68930.1 MAG: 50S ribosomal protein L35 [candidate division WWE3 bacterium CG_4_8_14_3_um_filter_42_11]
MPKLKTKKIVAKRFKITGSGRIFRLHSKTSHLKSKQSSKTKRRKKGFVEVLKSDLKKVKRLMPYR